MLVRARGCDDVVDVGDRDDPSPQGDLFTARSIRIASSVPALVVVGDGFAPLAEPGTERLDQRVTKFRVTSQDRPLRVARSTVLREDLARDLELADVVEEG